MACEALENAPDITDADELASAAADALSGAEWGFEE
jgi:hypothetical protein